MADCLFCKIVRREIAADEVFRDDDVVAFRDLNPQAPHHLLVVPTHHVAHLSEYIANTADATHASRLLATAARLGREAGGPGGYRIVANEGPDAGQTVHHLHIHVLAGRTLGWPPG